MSNYRKPDGWKQMQRLTKHFRHVLKPCCLRVSLPILFCVILFGPAPLQAQAISPDSLVLHLPFNGNTLDVSGNNYHGTAFNTVYDTGANGQAGGSIVFNGSDGYVTIPNVTQLDGQMTDFTLLVRMWVATVAPQPGIQSPYTTSYHFLYWHRNIADSSRGFLRAKMRTVWQGPSQGTQPNQAFLGYIMDWCSGNVGTSSGYNRPQTQIVGKWVTFTMRYHRGTMEIYHNCERVNYWPNIYPAISDLCGTEPMQLTLGLVPQAVFQYGYRFFNGKIDDLRFYKRALTDDEISIYTDSTCRKLPTPELRIQIVTPDPCSPEQITAKDISVLNGDSLIGRTWRIFSDSSVADTMRYRFLQTGVHRIRLQYVTKSGTYIKDTTITISRLGRIRFLNAVKNKVVICQGSAATLQVSGGNTYRWEPCIGLDKCDQPQVTASPAQHTRYKIVGTNTTGCSDSIYIDANVIADTMKVWVPAAFSPNGDGLNETFGLLSFSPLAAARLNIYNRWGQVVFNSRQPAGRWNGKLNGTPQPTGHYTWMAQYKTGEGCMEKQLSGVVRLIQ